MIRIHHPYRVVIGTLGLALLVGVVQPRVAHAAGYGVQPRGGGHPALGQIGTAAGHDSRGSRGSRDPRGAGRCRGTGHGTPTPGQGAGGVTSPGATATPVVYGTLATPTPMAAASSMGTTGSVAALLTTQAQAAGVDPALVKAVAWQESGWQMVTAADGGIGIMQLMPSTVTWVETALLGQTINPYDPAQNVRAGVAILRYYLSVLGNERLAIAAYHQGLQGVRTSGVSAATAQYVASVLALQQRFA